MLPLVALVGRPNVGKSTLFNGLTRTRDAVVHDEPGVTRDRHYGICRLDPNRPFAVCDTGGLSDSEEGLAGAAAKQSRAAAEEADLVLFVVDGREGPSALDQSILAWLRKSGRPFFLIVNKTDGLDENACLNEFAFFGVECVLSIAAAHQRGIPDLVQAVLSRLPEDSDVDASKDDSGRLRVAFIGRPNVGKSTLVNRLLGEERMIASEVPGTTRDSIAVDLERDGRAYRLIDTAGLRQRGKVEEAVEKFSVFKTLQAVQSCQVAVVMLDAGEGVTEQDATVLGHVLEAGKALVVAVNKWDGQSDYQRDQTRGLLDRKLGFCPWAERVTLSAKHGTGIRELFGAIRRAHASATHKFGTAETTKALEIAYASFPPPVVRGHVAKLRFAHPGGENPPLFVVHGTRLRTLPDSYRRDLENFFRKRFKLVGTPIKFVFKETENPYQGKKNELTDKQIEKRRRLVRHHKRK
jgi:GTP-binding protein